MKEESLLQGAGGAELKACSAVGRRVATDKYGEAPEFCE